MNSILSIIRSSLDGGAVAQIGDNLGEGLGKTHVAVGTTLPVLISALSNRASQDNGESLGHALDSDHDGDILHNVRSFLAAGDFHDGSQILGHVLGEKKAQTARAISNSTGFNVDKADTLLDMLAPIVMGAVGKVKKARQIDSLELTALLAGEEADIDRKLPGVISTVGVFLSTDNDGEAELTDLMARGRNLLNEFF